MAILDLVVSGPDFVVFSYFQRLSLDIFWNTWEKMNYKRLIFLIFYMFQ